MHAASPRGVIAAIVTPVQDDGRPDAGRFIRHAEWLLANGCDGLNVLGTTGEATSFARDDRMALMSAAAEALDPARMLVGTGCPDLASSVVLTRHAHEKGFAGALVLPPYYFKGVSDRGLFAYFEALIAATAAQPVPIYLYNFPQMTGLTFSPALVRDLVAAFPDRIRGLKDSSGTTEYQVELARLPGFQVYPSDEGALAEAEAQGFAGCISATVNLTAPFAQRLWRAQGDAGLLAEVRRLRREISAVPLVPAVKHLVARLHGDEGYARLLPPLMPLAPDEAARLPEIHATSHDSENA